MNQSIRILTCAACLALALACAETKNHSGSADSSTAKQPNETAKSTRTTASQSPSMKAPAPVESDRYQADGYAVYESDGRLWVFRAGSEEHKSFAAKGAPAERVTLIGAGPDGMTVLGTDMNVVAAYCAPYRYGVPGFVVVADDGRLWVFREGGEDYAAYLAKGPPAERATLIGAGPDGMTLVGADIEVVRAYRVAAVYGKPGFEVFEDDGRLWVFRAGSEAPASYRARGAPAERVTLIGAGPEGITIMGEDRATLAAYTGGGRP